MTRKEQNEILDAKIKSNINQYKVDRLNAEISAFSSGDLNKYEFLTRKDLKYKPNALDKARFNFSPLGKAFSVGLDKTSQGYQEEGVIKLLKILEIVYRMVQIVDLMIIDLMMDLITMDLMMIHLMMIHLMMIQMIIDLMILMINIVDCCLNIFN